MANFKRIEFGYNRVTYATVFAQPSYHVPFSSMFFFFGCLGVGAAIVYSNCPGAGFAIALRLGVTVMVGGSGILAPSLRRLHGIAFRVHKPRPIARVELGKGNKGANAPFVLGILLLI